MGWRHDYTQKGCHQAANASTLNLTQRLEALENTFKTQDSNIQQAIATASERFHTTSVLTQAADASIQDLTRRLEALENTFKTQGGNTEQAIAATSERLEHAPTASGVAWTRRLRDERSGWRG